MLNDSFFFINMLNDFLFYRFYKVYSLQGAGLVAYISFQNIQGPICYISDVICKSAWN